LPEIGRRAEARSLSRMAKSDGKRAGMRSRHQTDTDPAQVLWHEQQGVPEEGTAHGRSICNQLNLLALLEFAFSLRRVRLRSCDQAPSLE